MAGAVSHDRPNPWYGTYAIQRRNGRLKMQYRVVYGETMPAWEKIFDSKHEAQVFAKEHESFGDIVFSITKVIKGEAPQSLQAAIDAGLVK